VFPTAPSPATTRTSESFAIRVEQLSKQYVIGRNRRGGESFREALMTTLSTPFHYFARGRTAAADEEEFWALKDVSFDIRKGEIVGIIGRNGAGKSTLLKILSRITEPTRGRIEIRGRVSSLLEVGTGFHGELTGRENVYLNGAILGMTRSEIDRKFDEIISFAEVEKFLETPVKHYSSGMYIRLAFAVAAHLETDILLVDEVLAVGDVQFQNKCLGKMEVVAGQGRTVLFVSHNLGAVQRLCSRAILLERQQIKYIGNVEAAISKFLTDSSLAEAVPLIGTLSECIELKSVSINDQEFLHGVEIKPRSEILLKLVFNTGDVIKRAKVIVSITKDGRKIIDLHDSPKPKDMSPGLHEVRVSLPPFFLSPGQYGVGVLCYSAETQLSTWSSNLGSFVIMPEPDDDYDIWNMGVVNLPGRGGRIAIAD
jgi:lipopolysaccharide transport system ATP-binding protein